MGPPEIWNLCLDIYSRVSGLRYLHSQLERYCLSRPQMRPWVVGRTLWFGGLSTNVWLVVATRLNNKKKLTIDWCNGRNRLEIANRARLSCNEIWLLEIQVDELRPDDNTFALLILTTPFDSLFPGSGSVLLPFRFGAAPCRAKIPVALRLC